MNARHRSRAHLVLAAGVVAAAVATAVLSWPPLLAQGQGTDAVDARALQDLRWRNIGPARGGRVTAFDGVRTEPCTHYMGSTGGGVWKTVNCGISWQPMSDGQIETGSIGAIAVSDSRPAVVYAGTGSAPIRSNVIIGRGMYKSIDAGRTWRFIGLREAGQIGSVIVHPTNPDVVWVAALGSPYGPTDERGIFKSIDGGVSWKKTLFVNNETGGRVLAVNRSNPAELYAGMYRGFRKGWDIISGGPADQGGIYKSNDGGDTWTKLSAGLPRTLIGKIDLDVAQSRPGTVFAMIEAPGAEGGLYRTTDAGATWTLVNNEERLRTRPFYFHYVDVNPKNEDEVWINELRLWKSSDAGKTWTEVATPHGDNHGMWFNPDRPEYILQVNDGGANVSTDGGQSWSSILNQPTAEFYMVTVDDQFPYRLYGPQQDNSTVVIPSLPPVSWNLDSPEQIWSQASGCETGQIMPRPDGRVVYGVCKGEFGRYSIDTGQEKHYWVYPQNRYGHNPIDIKYRFPRQSVILVSPHDPGTVYHASHVIHRTTDEGVTWQVISPDLTANEPDKQVLSGTPITRDITGEEVYSSIYAMNESRLERGVLWVGANDGPVHVSRDGGKTWKNVTPRDLPPGGRIQTIEDSPHRKGSAYVAAYRYMREHDLQPYIYVTNDYGATWTKLTDGRNGIPVDHPTRVVREDPDVQGLLYAGTEFGAFVSFDNGKRWQSLQLNLPATPVTDIRVHRKDLVISTMGRSFWIMDDLSPLQQMAASLSRASQPSSGRAIESRGDQAVATAPTAGEFSRSAALFLFQPRPAYRLRYEASSGNWARPDYPRAGATLDYYFAAAPVGKVSLEILTSQGRVVRRLDVDSSAQTDGQASAMRAPGSPTGTTATLPVRAGLNRFVWDLRYPGAWTASAPEGGAGGPLVPSGSYVVKLTVGQSTVSRPLEVKTDPRVLADGVTEADIQAQTALLLEVRDAISDTRKLARELDGAREAAAGDASRVKSIDAVLARIRTASGPYPQPMLLDQFANVSRMLSQADQRPGKDARLRLDDLLKELGAIRTQSAAFKR